MKLTRNTIYLLMVVAIGTILRFSWLDRESLWLDEFTSIEVARNSFFDILKGQGFDHHTPPLYYVLLHPWLQLFGESEAALRSFSAAVDLIALVLFALLGNRILGAQYTLPAATIYALHPFALYYAREGRMYSLVIVFAVSIALLAQRFVRGVVSIRDVALLTILVTAAAYTHYYLVLLILSVTVGIIVECGFSNEEARRRVRLWLSGCILAAIAFLPWLATVLSLYSSGGQSFRSKELADLLLVFPYTFLRFSVGYAVLPITVTLKETPLAALRAEAAVVLPLLLLSAGIFLYGALKFLQLHRFRALILSSVLLTPLLAFALSLKSPMLSERYLTAIFPFFLLLIIASWDPRHRRSIAILGAGLVVIAFSSALLYINPFYGKANWRGVAQYIAANERQPVIVDPQYCEGVFEYYSRTEVSRVDSVSELPASIWLIEAGLRDTQRAALLAQGFKVVSAKLFPEEIGLRVYDLERSSN